MYVNTNTLLTRAQEGGYAIAGFNLYDTNGIRAIIQAAESICSPVILQFHPAAVKHGGLGLLSAALQSAKLAKVDVAVHLDHTTQIEDFTSAVQLGLTSIMADGSAHSFEENVRFTQDVVHRYPGIDIEAELGRIAGTEDDLTVEAYEAKLTDPSMAARFVEATGVSSLAICIGNAHGRYKTPPKIDFDRLTAIRKATPVPLVLHGASGLDDAVVRRTIELGISKFNVNTEVRQAYVESLQGHLESSSAPDLVPLLQGAVDAMATVALKKMTLFGSVNQSSHAS